jgi:hypothetical protein
MEGMLETPRYLSQPVFPECRRLLEEFQIGVYEKRACKVEARKELGRRLVKKRSVCGSVPSPNKS